MRLRFLVTLAVASVTDGYLEHGNILLPWKHCLLCAKVCHSPVTPRSDNAFMDRSCILHAHTHARVYGCKTPAQTRTQALNTLLLIGVA